MSPCHFPAYHYCCCCCCLIKHSQSDASAAPLPLPPKPLQTECFHSICHGCAALWISVYCRSKLCISGKFPTTTNQTQKCCRQTNAQLSFPTPPGNISQLMPKLQSFGSTLKSELVFKISLFSTKISEIWLKVLPASESLGKSSFSQGNLFHASTMSPLTKTAQHCNALH